MELELYHIDYVDNTHDPTTYEIIDILESWLQQGALMSIKGDWAAGRAPYDNRNTFLFEATLTFFNADDSQVLLTLFVCVCVCVFLQIKKYGKKRN